MTLLLLGATGLVGRHVLELALADPRVAHVAAPTRRPLPAHPRLANPTAQELERLVTEPSLWPADAVVCALGTTLKQAGSREAFRRVDHDLPLAFARAARERGTGTFALVSSIGASARSPFFYTRVKGELEEALGALAFPSLYVARPNFIEGDRPESRPLEAVSRRVLHALAPVLPRSARANPAEHIAKALLEAAVAPTPGARVAASAEFA